MEIYINDKGDNNVGIQPNEMKIFWNFNTKDMNIAERNALKVAFEIFVIETLDFNKPVDIYFNDECPECFNILDKERSCPKKDCINNKSAYNTQKIKELTGF